MVQYLVFSSNFFYNWCYKLQKFNSWKKMLKANKMLACLEERQRTSIFFFLIGQTESCLDLSCWFTALWHFLLCLKKNKKINLLHSWHLASLLTLLRNHLCFVRQSNFLLALPLMALQTWVWKKQKVMKWSL